MTPEERGDVLMALCGAGWYVKIERPPEHERSEDWSPDWVQLEAFRLRPDGDGERVVIAGLPQLRTIEYRISVAGARDKAIDELKRLCEAAIP